MVFTKKEWINTRVPAVQDERFETLEDALVQAGAAARSLTPLPLRSVTHTALETDDVLPVTMLGDVAWGRIGTALYFSTDGARTWTRRGSSPIGDTLHDLREVPGGEVLALCANGIWRSDGWSNDAPTVWTKTAAPNGATYFLPWSLAGEGDVWMTTEYGAGAGYVDSRYVRRTLDGGRTWDVVYDSVARHGETLANASHLHGIAYDPWTGRFYVSEGHGTIAGLYVTEDNGATWTRPAGLGTLDPSPTAMEATDDGLVCGSDNPAGGLYGVLRQEDFTKEEFTRLSVWNPGVNGTNGFGLQARRDPSTGVVFITYRTEKVAVKPPIMAGTPTTGAVVYEWAGGHAAYDDIQGLIIPEPGRLVCYARINGGANITRIDASIPSPGTVNATLADRGAVLGGSVTASDSTAVGPNSSTNGIRSVAIGTGAIANAAQDATAIGSGASASTVGATAIGQGAAVTGTGTNGIAIGQAASVTGSNAVAIGKSASAVGGGVAIGINVVAKTMSTLVGDGVIHNNDVGSAGTAMGYRAKVQVNGVAMGVNAAALSTDGTCIGHTASTAGAQATALGKSAVANGLNSVALGANTTASAAQEVAIGPRFLSALVTAAEPAAPASGGAHLFVRTTGGKEELCVKFKSGAVQVLATEP